MPIRSRRSSRIYSTEDARGLAWRRLPRLVFDFVDGAAGRETGAARNQASFDEIMLRPRVMTNVSSQSLTTKLLDRTYDVPFGIAPMGMCNLVCPHADRHMAKTAHAMNFPVCLSSAGSSSMEDMRSWAGDQAWFQLYFGHSTEASLSVVDRALKAGYGTLVLTVDVPKVSRRLRDLRNGFHVPFTFSARAFWDFALHPRWSLSTLIAGVPGPRNFPDGSSNGKFDRGASRAGADWEFLKLIRERWPGKLIVKGVTCPEDATKICEFGADAIYVSNHGARQLDSAPPAIQLLPLIRRAVGPNYPLLFDGGVRNGEDVVKALALGADFVMLGRAPLFALGADNQAGLEALFKGMAHDIGITLAQIGISKIENLNNEVIFANATMSHTAGESRASIMPPVAVKS
ncbi:MAG: alpha-hydroxy acid oxidase [Rhizobiaceae bacterium]